MINSDKFTTIHMPIYKYNITATTIDKEQLVNNKKESSLSPLLPAKVQSRYVEGGKCIFTIQYSIIFLELALSDTGLKFTAA